MRNKLYADEQARKQLEIESRKRIEGDHQLKDAILDGGNWKAAQKALKELSNPQWFSASKVIKEEEEVFSHEPPEPLNKKDLENLRDEMSHLKLFNKWHPVDLKVVPERIYFCAMHPSPDKRLVFAGDKIGHLGVWDVDQEESSTQVKSEDDDDDALPLIYTFKIHTRSISVFAFDPSDAGSLFTGSYDTTIRKFDITSGISSEVYVPSYNESEREELITGLDIDPSGKVISFSNISGVFGIVDIRDGTKKQWTLHEKKIGGMSRYPLKRDYLCTASNDRTTKIWDIRTFGKSTTIPDYIGSYESSKSISSAYWNSRGYVVTTSYDDTVRIFKHNLNVWDKYQPINSEFKPFTTIRHNNQTGRWVTILRAQWQSHPAQYQKLCIGNMRQGIDVFSDQGDLLAHLTDDRITAVPAVTQFHPTENVIASGNASGKICLFTKDGL